MSIVGRYRAGPSPVHRLPAGAKLIALVVLALVATVPPPTAWNLGAVAAVTAAVYLVAGLGLAEIGRQVLLVRWLVAVALIAQLVFLPIPTALGNTARLVLVLLLAAAVTLTTPMGDVLDAFHRALLPLRPLGVDPDRVALVLALTIRAVPAVVEISADIRDAVRARGSRGSVRAHVVPLLVLALRRADDTADALAARGVE